MHSRHALVVLRVDVRARTQQHFDDFDVAVLRGDEQRGVAELVADVDWDTLRENGCDFFVPAVACAREEKTKSVGSWGRPWRSGMWKDDWRGGEEEGSGSDREVEPVPSVSLDEEKEEEEEEEEDEVIDAATALSSATEPVRRLRSSRT